MKLLKQTLQAYSEATKGDESAPLYVVNTAQSTDNGQTSQIALHFSVKSEGGNTIPVSLPATWIPIDLTTRAHRNLIIKDPNFRDLLQKGHISIVASTVDSERTKKGFIGAIEAYKDKSVSDEFESIFSNSHMTRTLEEIEPDEDESISLGAKRASANEMTASFVAQSIVDRCTNGESPATILRTIRQKSVSLSPADLQYIMQESTDSSVKGLCAELLNGDVEE
jgi:hypothetical protein